MCPRAAVTQDEGGEHVELASEEGAERDDFGGLSVSIGISDDAARGVWGASFEKCFEDPVDKFLACFALNVVEDGDDVAFSEGGCAVKDPFLWAEEVGEGEGCEVVGEGGPEEGCAGGCGGDSGDDLKFERWVFREHLEHEGCHSIDADIAGGEETDLAAMGGEFDGFGGSFPFLGERERVNRGVGGE